MMLIQTYLSSCISSLDTLEFSLKKACIHRRRRDHLGRFLPHDNQEEPLNIHYLKLEEPQSENEEE